MPLFRRRRGAQPPSPTEPEATEIVLPPPEELVRSIRPRLWGREMLSSVEVPVLSRPVAADVKAVLCVDLENAVVNLGPAQAEATGLSEDALWDLANRQIDDGLAVNEDLLGDGISTLVGESHFVASRLLELERFADRLPSAGALVAIPHRHVLIIHRIESLQAVQALSLILQISDGLYRKGPGSIVPHVYWWRHERPLVHIPADVGARGVSVSPPDEFIELLNGLEE